MHFFATKGKTRILTNLVLLLYIGHFVEADYTVYTVENRESPIGPDFVLLGHQRYRRQAPAPTAVPSPAATAQPAPTAVPPPAPTAVPPPAPTALSAPTGAPNATVADNDKNKTTKQTVPETTTLPAAVVTRIPLLGVNGSGIFRGNSSNPPLVSEQPPLSDDILAEIFGQESPEMIKAQQNISDLNYDNHVFYNSTFIGNRTYFEEHWANITAPKQLVHNMLSNSYRRAITMNMTFAFPFYGTLLHKITVATGGFIYTGSQLHNWLAATQYIAPLMANFETKGQDDSLIKFMDDGEKFTTLWENVYLREEPLSRFTFAATLYKNGDIVFAYRNISKPVQQIADNEHPVKVGISDAYHTDRVMFLVRRKTIFEYHRVSFKDHHEITNATIIRLVALPTCLQYDNCYDCLNHNTTFNCTWCDQIQRCSSGTDRSKQDWTLRNCNRTSIVAASACPAENRTVNRTLAGADAETTPGDHSDDHNLLIPQPGGAPGAQSPLTDTPAAPAAAGLSAGGVVAALLLVALVSLAAGWAAYAFKNPHTPSGQLFIKYRPSQWSWKRGEARYTAATIHM